MKIFTRLATLLGRLREREADTNPEATKPKKKNKAGSSGGSSGNKKKRRLTQTVLKPCLKHPDPNAKPKKRKWSIKFSERVTVYEIQEIVDNTKKKATITSATPDDASKGLNVQNSDRVSKTGNMTPPTTEYKTRLRIYYDQLAKPSKKNKKLLSENDLHK